MWFVQEIPGIICNLRKKILLAIITLNIFTRFPVTNKWILDDRTICPSMIYYRDARSDSMLTTKLTIFCYPTRHCYQISANYWENILGRLLLSSALLAVIGLTNIRQVLVAVKFQANPTLLTNSWVLSLCFISAKQINLKKV